MGYVLLGESGGGPVFTWLAFVLLATVARGIVHYQFERAMPGRSTVSASTKLAFLVTICFSGLVWGGGATLLFPADNLALQAFLIVAILGMGAGATAGFGPYFPALAVYVIPLAVPMVAILMFQQTMLHVAFGGFGLAFIVVLLLLGSAAHRNFALSSRLDFENAFLTLGLEQSEERFRDFTAAASDWVFELDAELRFTTVSGRYGAVSGFGPDHLIGKKVTEFPSLNEDSDWRVMAAAFAGQRPFHNLRITRPDVNGEPFHFLSSGIPVFSDDGTFRGYRGTGSDITAIVRAEALARESRRQLLDAIESIPAGFILFDKDGCLVLWNLKAPGFLSASKELIKTGARYAALIRSSAESGHVIDAHDNEDAWIAEQMRWFDEPETACEFHLNDGRFVQKLGRRTADGGVVAILTDVTAARTAVAALEESEDRYRQLVESSPDSISIHKDGRLIFMNPAGARLFGVSSPEQLIGRRVLDFIHPDYHDYLRNSQPSALTDIAGGTFHEIRVLRNDGAEFDAEGISLEFMYRGQPAILGILRDITLRKLTQTQLVQTSKLASLGELAASITHELNQPLNVIRVAADSSLILMEQGKADQAFERKQFESISAQAVRMANIISHMKSFSRRQDDDDREEFFNPEETITAAVAMVRDQYTHGGVSIDVELLENSYLLRGHPVRLEQVILNLLTNAHDALVLEVVDPESGRPVKTARLGSIQVSVRCQMHDAADRDSGKRDIVIRIDDNGGGIPAEALDHVFDPFFTTKRTGQGAGLGLAISYNIVDSMGGRIVASNEAEGARFEVWLPIANYLDIADTVDLPAATDKATR
ncbi:MAG: PAS domain S-box-containing protein [Alphaproteobacteria bacterium]